MVPVGVRGDRIFYGLYLIGRSVSIDFTCRFTAFKAKLPSSLMQDTLVDQ